MPRIHITDVVVSRLNTPGTYYDQLTPAFGLRVGKRRKTWLIIRGRERIRTNIGQYPSLSLADARKEAKRLLTEPVTKVSRVTVQLAYDAFKSQHIATKKARTQADYTRMLERYFVPVLGKKKLGVLAYEDFTAITDKLADAPSEQAHALAVARTFLKWCVKPPRRYIQHSPLEGIKVINGKPRKRVLTEDELLQVWQSAERTGYPYGTIVQLLILTGQRRGETANLRWPWIDEKARTITLPDWVTKNGRTHVIPYGDMVASLLEAIPRRNSTDLLFPSTAGEDRPISGWSKYKLELDDGLEVKHYVLHDLRRTFGTKLAELKVLPHVVERLLNHTMGSISNRADSIVSAVAEVYNLAAYLPEMREAIEERWEPHLRSILQPR